MERWKTVDNKDKLYNETLDFVLRQSLKDGEIETELNDGWLFFRNCLGTLTKSN